MRPSVKDNATGLLRQDHWKLKDLFDLFEESEESSEQKEILETVMRDLRQHIQLGEQVFYPAIREVVPVDLFDQAQEEHQDLSAVLEDLQDLDLEDPLFLDKFMELEDKTQRHIQLEET